MRRSVINPLLNRLGGKWNKYTELSNQPLARRYTGVSFYETPVKEALYRPAIRNLFNGSAMPELVSRYYERTEGLDPLQRMMYLDVKSWLPDDLLIKADKMTMATSVELRVPFLDHRVVELGGRIPPRLRIKGWETKYVLKKALEPYLPKEILYRGKMGFPTPLARMFQGPLRGYVEEVLGERRCLDRGYFQPEAVRRMIAEHAAGEGTTTACSGSCWCWRSGTGSLSIGNAPMRQWSAGQSTLRSLTPWPPLPDGRGGTLPPERGGAVRFAPGRIELHDPLARRRNVLGRASRLCRKTGVAVEEQRLGLREAPLVGEAAPQDALRVGRAPAV